MTVLNWTRTLGIAAIAAMLIAGGAATTAEQASPPRIVGEVRQVVVARGDTLHAIGARHGVDAATIAHDNGVALNAPLRVGQTLTLDARHVVPSAVAPGLIVVNVPQRMVFWGGPSSIRAWPVAVGRRTWPTPLGPFTVVSREQHPTWDVPASILEEARRAGRSLPAKVPPGPDNPLGDYWLGLSLGSVGIHGTNAPSSIYQAATHGCIRMHPDDIDELFPMIAVGTRGVVIYEPILVAQIDGAIVLEVHRDVYGRGPADVRGYVWHQASALGVAERIDWTRVAAVAAEAAGVPRTVGR